MCFSLPDISSHHTQSFRIKQNLKKRKSLTQIKVPATISLEIKHGSHLHLQQNTTKEYIHYIQYI